MKSCQVSIRVILAAACFLPTNVLMADVLSSTTINDLVEPQSTYDRGTPSVLNMRVRTVIESGPCVTDDYAGCTLRDVLNDIDGSDDFKPEIKVHLTADDYPNDGSSSNAEMRQRGATSRGAPQKSFRIKLDDDAGLWRGEDRIQLVKSFWDFSRIRNKLSYDLFVDIPNLPSMRTQFVNFNVEDQGSVQSYGLYTQVEYVGKEYLERRGWDKDSRLYKAENFYFKNDPAFTLDSDGEPVDEDAFEKLMEIKRGDVHWNFVNMLKDLNNPALDFNSQVFSRYFNQDNYLTWLAVNILLDNNDTNFHNYYLYNPKASGTFYFVPWDYDLSLGASFDTGFIKREDQVRWAQSHANWWGQELHQQFLRQPGNLDRLRGAMDEIKARYLTRAKLQQKADSYYNIVFPLISSSPDINDLYIGGTDPEKIAAYNRIFSGLADKVSENYNRFIQRIGDPMPFVLNNPTLNSDQSYRFSWSPSESLLGQTVRYDLEISTTSNFESGTVIVRRNGIQATNVSIPWNYASGNYFYRVIARDANEPTRYLQVAYNQIDSSNGPVYGVVAFNATVNNGGAYPVGNLDTATTAQNTATTIDVLANDTGSGLKINSTDSWSLRGGRVSINNSRISYTPKQGFTGVDNLWYTFEDSQGRVSSAQVNITVQAGGAFIVAESDYYTAAVNTGKVLDVLANDTASSWLGIDTLYEYTAKGGKTYKTPEGKVWYVPKAGFTGEDNFWYVIIGAQGQKSSAQVKINVTGGSGAFAVANSDYYTTDQNTGKVLDILSNDTGGTWRAIDTLFEYTAKGGKSYKTPEGKVWYVPKAGFVGEDNFWYVMVDSEGRKRSAQAKINVTP